ncbi:hypothetical protein Cgig2_033747 [Carnegiea gigantea]|uniref:Uncharacterized protein n=1 Tax=Carnegiea gigantea TaxID=171969 RepID=A0A9Q1K187_9CARY|nr:hypothetical protein Cgig2_033747 [Carnegiea gigantea]
MVFGGKEVSRFASPHNDPLVVETKIASAIVRILIDTASFVDIITWDCLKKLTRPGRDIVPLVHLILGFDGQEVNPTSMIRLPVRFGDKLKVKNLEVDFLVVDIPTAYNVILGRSPLSSRPSSSEAPASASKGLVATSHAPSPSPEGGINSTSSGSRPSSSARWRLSTLASPRPCADTLRYRHGPIDSLAPWLEQPFQPLRSPQPWPLKAQVFLLSLPGVLFSLQLFPVLLVPSCQSLQLRHSATALTPRVNTSANVTSSSVIFGGSEVAKSQDLTKSWISENLATGLALIKLVDGRWALGGEPSTA